MNDVTATLIFAAGAKIAARDVNTDIKKMKLENAVSLELTVLYFRLTREAKTVML